MLPGECIELGLDPRCPNCEVEVRLEVLSSAAGYYIGTRCKCGPYSRESPYYETAEFARQMLADGRDSFARV